MCLHKAQKCFISKRLNINYLKNQNVLNNMAPGGQDVEFDYNIHFPPPSDVIEPVVILLGWAGCKEKNLRKYSSLYETK